MTSLTLKLVIFLFYLLVQILNTSPQSHIQTIASWGHSHALRFNYCALAIARRCLSSPDDFVSTSYCTYASIYAPRKTSWSTFFNSSLECINATLACLFPTIPSSLPYVVHLDSLQHFLFFSCMDTTSTIREVKHYSFLFCHPLMFRSHIPEVSEHFHCTP